MKHDVPMILLIDDEDEILDLYSAKFQGADYEVLVARDGYEGIDEAKDNQPDIILLDIMMPGLTGMETLAKLKEDPVTTNIPVVFLTAAASTDSEMNAAKKAGVAAFLTKDIEPDELIEQIEQILRAPVVVVEKP